MRKKLTIFLMLILCVITLCGCGSVNYGITIGSDGSITESVSVYFDGDALLALGKNSTEVKLRIQQQANSIMQNRFIAFERNPKSSMLISGTTKTVREYVYENISPNNGTASVNITSDGIEISFKFLTAQAYYWFYDIDVNSNDDIIYQDNIYYVTETENSHTVFHDIANNSIAKDWLSYFGSTELDLENMTYNFVYSTPHEKFHSNADYTTTDYNGNTAHVWSFEYADLSGENAENGDLISLYTVGIKPAIWYITAIALTGVLISVLLIISVIKEHKKQNKFIYDGSKLIDGNQ